MPKVPNGTEKDTKLSRKYGPPSPSKYPSIFNSFKNLYVFIWSPTAICGVDWDTETGKSDEQETKYYIYEETESDPDASHIYSLLQCAARDTFEAFKCCINNPHVSILLLLRFSFSLCLCWITCLVCCVVFEGSQRLCNIRFGSAVICM